MKAHWFEVVIGIAIVAFVVLLACTLAEASRLERAYSTARAVCEAVKMQVDARRADLANHVRKIADKVKGIGFAAGG